VAQALLHLIPLAMLAHYSISIPNGSVLATTVAYLPNQIR
jgi:hypothetical protein